MNDDLIIANQNLKDASKKLSTVHNSVVKIQSTMRNKSMDFYNRLSLLAGGVLSLSITYIGYLSSSPSRQINYAELLFSGWTFLLMAIFSGIYRNHFNLNMGHYQTLNSVNRARMEEYEATLKLLGLNPGQFINLTTKEDIEKQITVTKRSLDVVKEAIKHNEKCEKRESFMWTLTQSMSHMGFIMGIILITVFAAINLPITVNFNILKPLLSK